MKVLETIIDEVGFERTLARLAHEIIERNRDLSNVAILGLRTRGEFVARRLRDKITAAEKTEVPFGILDVTLYRDDVRQHLRQPEVKTSNIDFDTTNKDIILVDDVLFTGRTVRAALNALVDFGRSHTIQLAVLVDRGHRELPIRADFIGKTVPTSRGQEIRVRLKEVDGSDGIDIVSMD